MSPRGRWQTQAPLAPLTTWRVGGPAEVLFEPADRADLQAVLRALPADTPLTWLGLGSNVLIRDGGIRGVVIRLASTLDAIAVDRAGARLVAEAGAHCARVAKVARDAGLAALGFLAGIPGSIGGALAMNAGAWGGETWPEVEAAEVIYRDGRTEWLPADAMRYAYREVQMPAGVAGFLAARFRVREDVNAVHATATRDSLARRKASQPVGRPSAGSTFRNPPGDHAARLIEACGLKGLTIGGASVSTQHSNFILTAPGACAADVEALIAEIRHRVAAQTGVSLHTEVRVLGEAT